MQLYHRNSKDPPNLLSISSLIMVITGNNLIFSYITKCHGQPAVHPLMIMRFSLLLAVKADKLTFLPFYFNSLVYHIFLVPKAKSDRFSFEIKRNHLICKQQRKLGRYLDDKSWKVCRNQWQIKGGQ